MAHIVMIVPSEQFRDEELFETRTELERAGHSTVIASATTRPCSGMLGGWVVPTLTLAQVDPEAFDAVIFVGGLGVRQYYHDPQAHRIAREMHGRGKVVAAICLAPVVLANAGLLTGKHATVSASEAKTLQRLGARYQATGVVVDGALVTGDGPTSARRFGREIAALLTAVAA